MLADFISYLVFGNHCKYCGELIKFGETLCNECQRDLPRITGEKCKYCGAGKDRCSCKKSKMKYDGICAPFYYEKTIETEYINTNLLISNIFQECSLRIYPKL